MLSVAVTVLTGRLALVSGGAAVWHLQVGLTAATVLHGLWGLNCRRHRGACKIRKTSAQFFYNSSTGQNQSQRQLKSLFPTDKLLLAGVLLHVLV